MQRNCTLKGVLKWRDLALILKLKVPTLDIETKRNVLRASNTKVPSFGQIVKYIILFLGLTTPLVYKTGSSHLGYIRFWRIDNSYLWRFPPLDSFSSLKKILRIPLYFVINPHPTKKNTIPERKESWNLLTLWGSVV